MRLWSLHPKYLDAPGLVALWREALLAQAVLRGSTRGYKHHPQLERFRAHPQPRSAINFYLAGVHAEASIRGYSFDAAKVGPVRHVARMAVTIGQITYEWEHLLLKLKARSPDLFAKWSTLGNPTSHPLFSPRPGPVAAWERMNVIPDSTLAQATSAAWHPGNRRGS
jgi:pyrimidine dimer DNA glycosylase